MLVGIFFLKEFFFWGVGLHVFFSTLSGKALITSLPLVLGPMFSSMLILNIEEAHFLVVELLQSIDVY